jgi:hypothetical protein
MGEYMGGSSDAVIARWHGISETTVRYTINMETPRGVDEGALRVSMSQTLSPLAVREILKGIRRDPYMSYNDMRLESGKPVSDKGLLRILRSSGYERKAKKVDSDRWQNCRKTLRVCFGMPKLPVEFSAKQQAQQAILRPISRYLLQ